MNATGLNIIKTLGCMTAGTLFAIFNTRERYDYFYHRILGVFNLFSTTVTPFVFVCACYLDGHARHCSDWETGQI